jgi:hypothetical protein
MARARNIKPGFYENEELGACSMEARLCFPALWQLADRDGRLEDRPLRIKGFAFRYDSIEIEPLLQELADHGFILRYRVADQSLIQVITFAKHQNPHHREAPSTLPAPPGWAPEAAKPEAQGSCHDGEAQGQPEASPGPAQGQPEAKGPCKGGQAVLNPESGFLNPDSLNPSSSSADHRADGSAVAAKPKRARATKALAPTADTWEAYRSAYAERYKVDPARNANVNGKVSQFVARIGAEEAPAIAAFYVRHQEPFYVRSMHTVGLLLRDAEKLRTEWKTGHLAFEAVPNARSRHSGFDSVDYSAQENMK